MKYIRRLRAINRIDKLRIKDNQNEVNEYNKTMNLGILRSAIVVLLLPLLASPFLEHFVSRVAICLVAMGALLAIFFVCKKGYLDDKPLVGLYLTISTGSVITILLSVIASPDQRATILLGTLCVIPIIYIDYFSRKFLYTFSILVVHSVLAFYFKSPTLAFADTLNCVCLLIIGSFIGHIMQHTKLTALELKRNLVFERETDILTGLKNRRKMVELFDDVNAKRISKPCCAVLLDIDHFKQYNDLYGHSVGDELLQEFGKILLDFESRYNIKFYRYGGEEFSAFAWDYTQDQQIKLLEEIRYSVEFMNIEHKRTVSIGYITDLNKSDLNLEKALAFADIALYEAKNRGRNQVVCYDSSFVG